MDRIVRIQTWSGIGTVISFPILYVGAVNELILLEVLGFALFAISMLTTPVLRFMPEAEPVAEPEEQSTPEEDVFEEPPHEPRGGIGG